MLLDGNLMVMSCICLTATIVVRYLAFHALHIIGFECEKNSLRRLQGMGW